MTFIDILLVVLIVLVVFIGYKKGLIVSLLGLAKVTIGLPVAYSISQQYSSFVYDTFAKGEVIKAIGNEIDKFSSVDEYAANLDGNLSSIPQFVSSAIDISQLKNTTRDVAIDYIEQSIARPIATMIIELILLLVIFSIISLAVTLLIMVFKKFNKIKNMPLKYSNRVAGALFGAVKAFIYIALIALVSSYFLELYTGENNEFVTGLRDSVIINYING